VADDSVAALVAKDEIRELALLYCRGVDRKDYELIRSLYTDDATDSHGDKHYATMDSFIDRLKVVLPAQRNTGHYVCNHLINVDGEAAEGEVYAVATFRVADGAGWVEHMLGVRYCDRYRKDAGRWRFAKRVVAIDWEKTAPAEGPHEVAAEPAKDISYPTLESALFQRGARA
jgi:hypothetical protein